MNIIRNVHNILNMNVYGQHDSTYQGALYKLKIVCKTWQQKHSGKYVF